MPAKFKRPCRYPGCPALVLDSSFCADHANAGRSYANERADVNPDLARAKAFYKSPQWRRLRAHVLATCPRCPCGLPATMVDHITPINQGGDKLDPRNLQQMCNSCHARKRQQESMTARGHAPPPGVSPFRRKYRN